MKKIFTYSTLLFTSVLLLGTQNQLTRADTIEQDTVSTQALIEQTKIAENVPLATDTDTFSQGRLSYTSEDQATITSDALLSDQESTNSDLSTTSNNLQATSSYQGGYTITYPGNGGETIVITYKDPQIYTWTWGYGDDLTETPEKPTIEEGQANPDQDSPFSSEETDDQTGLIPVPSTDPKQNPNQDNQEPANPDTPLELGATTGARWDQPVASIYLDPNLNPTFYNAYVEAVNQWNNTGAFTFLFVDNMTDANIIATQNYNPNTNAAGVTESRYDPYKGRMHSATIRLNGYYLLNPQFGYSQERITNTAAHELAHAIGLDHNDGDSLMQPAGSYTGIREVDINTVRQLYKNSEKPSLTA